jgi:hypothetical protein
LSDTDVATDISQQEAPVATAPQEKMLPQSEVDKIVGARLARERAQMEAQYQNRQGMGGMQPQAPAIDEEAILEKATQRMQSQFEAQKRETEEAQQRAQVDAMARTYLEKMKQGPTLYEDFEEVTKGFKPNKYPQVAVIAAELENTPDIIYDLRKNPQKLATLQMFALNEDYDELREELTKLSKSIKNNSQSLSQNQKSPQPLTKLKSSAFAGQDTGKRTISDMRKESRFKV